MNLIICTGTSQWFHRESAQNSSIAYDAQTWQVIPFSDMDSMNDYIVANGLAPMNDTPEGLEDEAV